MPAPYTRAGFFRCAFLHNAPPPYALMLTTDRTRHLAQKYGRQRERIADAIIDRHQASEIALVAWSAHAYLLPLERDAGGITAIHAYPGMAKLDPRDCHFTVAGRNVAFRVSGIGARFESHAA